MLTMGVVSVLVILFLVQIYQLLATSRKIAQLEKRKQQLREQLAAKPSPPSRLNRSSRQKEQMSRGRKS